MKDAEKRRKAKGKGIVQQSKIVFEGKEGTKVSEDSGAGRSRGYGFIEYSSHRWALMGLRWLNGHQLTNASGKKQRLIVEFSIENAQVVQRRKENEEKARTRSKKVQEAREKGEMPPKPKKVLPKTRVASRPGVKVTRRKSLGRESSQKSGSDKAAAGNKAANKPGQGKKPGPISNGGEDEKLARREQIIQKKRMMRRNRKKSSA